MCLESAIVEKINNLSEILTKAFFRVAEFVVKINFDIRKPRSCFTVLKVDHPRRKIKTNFPTFNQKPIFTAHDETGQIKSSQFML